MRRRRPLDPPLILVNIGALVWFYESRKNPVWTEMGLLGLREKCSQHVMGTYILFPLSSLFSIHM